MLDDVMEDEELSEEADEQLDKGMLSHVHCSHVCFNSLVLRSNGRDFERCESGADHRRCTAGGRTTDNGRERRRCRRNGGSFGQTQSIIIINCLSFMLKRLFLDTCLLLFAKCRCFFAKDAANAERCFEKWSPTSSSMRSIKSLSSSTLVRHCIRRRCCSV